PGRLAGQGWDPETCPRDSPPSGEGPRPGPRPARFRSVALQSPGRPVRPPIRGAGARDDQSSHPGRESVLALAVEGRPGPRASPGPPGDGEPRGGSPPPSPRPDPRGGRPG